jgi:hypothetical protein
MLSLPVAEEVFNFLASDPAGPMASVLTAAHKPESPIFDSLNLFLTSIPKDVVAETCRDQNFKFCWNQAKDIDRMARIWIAERFLSDEIARRRLVALRNEDHSLRPAPYDHPALTDVAVDDEGLVPLSSFELDGSRLIHNGFAFTIFCTTSAPNSTYWVANILLNMATGSQISVRLDPFLLGPDADFPEMLYRMWQYGRPLDWQRISEIREPEHGRWIPKYSTDHGQSTDFCWEPRNGEVHFLCEELPKTDRVECEAARYFHAIYLPSAAMLFTWMERCESIHEVNSMIEVCVTLGTPGNAASGERSSARIPRSRETD